MPAAAIAGGRVFAGPQSLQLKVTASPSKASAQHLTLRLHIDYESTNGQRIMNVTKQILIVPPPGLTFNVHGAQQCSYNALVKGGVNACPKGSIVGSGSAVIDVRPLVPPTLTIPITLYNMTRGPRGSQNALLFYAGEFIFFDIFTNRNRQTLAYNESPPPAHSVLVYTLKTVNLSGRLPKFVDGFVGHAAS